jgi:FkbM family methyltransferase
MPLISNKLTSAYETMRDRGPVVMLKATGRLTCAATERALGRRYLLRHIHDYSMYLDVMDRGLSRSLLLFGTREVDHKVMLERIVRPGMTIFDIGGNIGYYPLMELGLLNGSGKLIVVEPSPSNAELLRRNLVLNNHEEVPVIEAAVSNVAEVRDFFLSEQSNLGTFHPVGSGSETLTGATVAVETLTVPLLAERFGAPDLIRMDVEGHEVEVLGGMVDAIDAGVLAPTIIFETHLSRYGKHHDMAVVLEALFARGYRVPLVSSSSDRGAERLRSLGYAPGQRIATDGIYRTLFEDIAPEDAISLICHSGGVRTVVLARV